MLNLVAELLVARRGESQLRPRGQEGSGGCGEGADCGAGGECGGGGGRCLAVAMVDSQAAAHVCLRARPGA